jgi:putative oxidoreductase
MLETVFTPLGDWGLLILRGVMAITFLVHGWFKVNPNGPVKGPAGFAPGLKQMGLPLAGLFAWIVILLETAGAGLLLLGLGTRLLAGLYAIEMLVVILLGKRRAWKVPFIAAQTTGWELDFVLLGQALALVTLGAGAISLDRMLGL